MAGNDANTLLLLHMDGTDGSTTFTDSSASARTVTAVGNAQIDTARSKFGGASGLFDGSGDYLTVPDSDDWAFGTGPLTIDVWVYLVTATSGGVICGQWTDANNGFRFGLRSDNGRIYFQIFSGGSAVLDLTTTTALSDATWTHVAVERTGNTWTIFKDGTSIGSTSNASSIGNYTSVLQIASGNSSTPGSTVLSSGSLDEFRISNIARYGGANFTPETEAYSAAAGQPTIKRLGGVPFVGRRGVW